MKLVTFGIDKERNYIIQFPVFVQPYPQQPLILYQLETVPIPIGDQNKHANSYIHLQIDRPYIGLNSETYISIRQQELRTCKKIVYELCCKELFVVKTHVQRHLNKTYITPTVLAGGNEIILENWPDNKHIICSINNVIPVMIPIHPYVLVNRSVLCNCEIEAENNFILNLLMHVMMQNPNL